MKHFDTVELLEIPGIITSIANIYLAARANIWNYALGVIAVSIYFFIFYHAKLYADMGLQVVYFALQFYGWYQWCYGGSKHTRLPITLTPRLMWVYGFTAMVLITLILSFILTKYTDSTVILVDSVTTSICLVAQWMMDRKWIENWFLWIIADIISVGMYLYKGLALTAALYFFFIALCIMGYRHWKYELVKPAPVVI
jgi:nicotinamide mononucleotide transporter